MNTARITVELGDARQAQAVHAALQPEARDGPEGTSATLTLDGIRLTAEIQAPDISGLRAAINSVVRLLDTATRAADAGGPQPLNR